MDLGEIDLGSVEWIAPSQGRCSECGSEPSESIKCWEASKWPHNWWPLK
jgi:hypothetical protein